VISAESDEDRSLLSIGAEQRQNDAATSTTPYTNVVPAITAE
jgi:hypothetical protein|tara:strand:+ start:539 stop:664 length:126 start_codon:yes stop_codon:yes gene_type:complete